MFDSLSDQMKRDEKASTTTTEVMIRWVTVAIVSVLVFGGLYFSVRMLE
ncbi:MAG: hypothetical protein ACKV22_23270 [Bryobacteraceae bacterium]